MKCDAMIVTQNHLELIVRMSSLFLGVVVNNAEDALIVLHGLEELDSKQSFIF